MVKNSEQTRRLSGALRAIEEAFDDVENSKKITLHVAEAHDNYYYENNKKHR